jgi:hypothetical protein
LGLPEYKIGTGSIVLDGLPRRNRRRSTLESKSDLGKMDDNSTGTGCAIVLGILLALPFFIAACPILAGIAVGLFFHFVIIPLVAWIIVMVLGLK